MLNENAIDEAIDSGKREIHDAINAKSILSLRLRRQIWRAMVDPEDADATYRRRVILQVLCVRRVQHLWDRAFPNDGRVEEMMAITEQLIRRQISPEEAELRSDDFLNEIYDEVENYDSITQPAVYVADASVHTVVSACYRNPDYNTSSTTTDDDELLPDSLEPSYACASAAAGALNWQPVEETDVAARRAFWLWYLDEAIPAALAS